VAADLSGQGLDEIRNDQQTEKLLAEQALREFEQKSLPPVGESRPDHQLQ
jgi:hypothetical protein